MSHSIYIFDLKLDGAPLPRTLVDFGDLLARHEELEIAGLGAVWNRRFVLFATELARRFPWKPEEARSKDDQIVWLNDPVAGALDMKSAVWNFELPRDAMEKVLACMVELAGKFNLVLYDDQVGIGFLPDGSIVPPHWADRIRSATPDDMRGARISTMAEAKQALRTAFEAELGPNGFQWVEYKGWDDSVMFERRIGPVFQQIYACALVSHDRCDSICLRIGHDEINEIVAPFMKAMNTSHSGNSIFLDGGNFFRRFGSFPLCTPHDAVPVARFIREKLLPLADIATDLFGIDQLLSHPSTAKIRTPSKMSQGIKGRPAGSDGSRDLASQLRGDYGPRHERLVAAWLNGNPRYAELEKEFFAFKVPPSGDEALDRKRLTEHAERQANARAFANHLRSIPPLHAWPSESAYEEALRPFPAQYCDCEPDPFEERLHNRDVAWFLEDALSAPVAFMARFGGEDGRRIWATYWRERGETIPERDRIAPDGLDWERLSWQPPDLPRPVELLILTFPPIEPRRFETQIIGLARCGPVWRAFFIENQDEVQPDGVGQKLRVITYLPKADDEDEPEKRYTATKPLSGIPAREALLDIVVKSLREGLAGDRN